MLEMLLSRFKSSASFVAPEFQAEFQAALVALAAHVDAPKLLEERAGSDETFWYPADDWRSYYRPYVVKDGILYIPVKGALLNDFPWQFGSYATGYIYIWKAFERGMADEEVKGIALMLHTPGGAVAENFDLVDRMYAMRGTKPVRAFAHEYAYSAGYSIASAADHIVVSRTGGVGSIGVVTAHVDLSKAMDNYGAKITFIFAGKHKVDGNPYQELPDDVKTRIQARIDELYAVFVATVARNRKMDEQAVRETEALTFTASEAVSNGLADSVGSLDDAMAAFAADLSNQGTGDEVMSEKNTAVDQAALDTARAEGHAAGKAEGLTTGKVEGLKEGTTTERTRISAIIASDVGAKRPIAALASALDTDMSVEQAATFLAKLPEESPKGKSSSFENQMNDGDHPNVGADESAGATGDDSIAARVLKNQVSVSGAIPKKA
jgi:signal peptide peptidase SppA